MLNRSLFSIILGIAVLGLFGFSQSAFAADPFSLNNGPGDGTLLVGVDGFGAFGLSSGSHTTNAFYDPVGPGGSASTTFESAIAIRFDTTSGARSFLASGLIGSSGGLSNPTVTGSSTSGSSTFSNGGLSFSLVQTLAPTFTGSSQTGTILTQTYTITNTGSTTTSFEIVRYLDGDLRFDGSLIDGGGRLFVGETEILFETDSATGSSTSTTFVGITGEGGTEPVLNRFEIDSWSGLLSRIISGTALDNIIKGDGDADQFIDAGAGYDVTLALRNTFSLGAEGSEVYVTKTIFGSGAPEDIQTSSPVGGTIIPIDATSLLIAGFDKNSFSLLGALTLVGAAAFGALYYTSKRKKLILISKVDRI